MSNTSDILQEFRNAIRGWAFADLKGLDNRIEHATQIAEKLPTDTPQGFHYHQCYASIDAMRARRADMIESGKEGEK